MEQYIGVDVGGSKILAVLASCVDGVKISSRIKVATHGTGEVAQRIEETIDSLLRESGSGRHSLAGIGLVLPGPIDEVVGGVVDCPNIPELIGVALRRRFEQRFGVPVGLENDAHAATLAEARDGAGKGFRNFLYLCLGTGIGCGIVINGELYKGANGAAGEVSHVIFPGLGSFYSLASGKALREKYRMDAKELEARCEDEDPLGLEALQSLIAYFGVGIGNLITILNPEAVVIGGGLAELGDRLLKPLEAEIRATAYAVSGRKVAILKAKLAADSGAIGAIHVARDWVRTRSAGEAVKN